MPRSRSGLSIRLLCLPLILALFLPGLALWLPEIKAAAFFRPQSPPPDTGLPDLDLQKMVNPPAPQAPNPIPSTAAPWSPYDVYPYLAGNYSWQIFNISTGTSTSQTWGVSGDRPVPADYDGDGRADVAVWRPSNGSWQIIKSSNGGIITQNWGVNGDVPVPADYDGDGKADIAVWRPSAGTWYIIKSSNGNTQTQGWGVGSDKPVPADYDGDGKADIAVWRPSNGSWQIIKSSNGGIMTPSWGINGDLLAPAQYDGDGKADLAICRASLPADNFANVRLDAANRTGQPGEDLFSGNFNWSLPLVGLAGRAGLDLGLSLTYNSLVWTRDDVAIKFNADNGYPSPGFRLGLPQIQGPFTSAQTGMPSFLMMPSGYRVELRQVGSTNLYESADSSYMQFDATSLVARMSDGTQLSFTLINQEYRCTEVKDRNGNFITANYDTVTGHLTSIIDTLGRTLTFVYDGFGNLQRITQPWNSVTHNWATFGYANKTLQTNFSGLTAIGPNNGSAQPVLTQVGLADGSRYVFSYNSYLQVNLITHKAPDDHELSHIAYDLPPAGVTQLSDCPRFSKRADLVERWNGGGEVETTFSLFSPTQSYGQVILPDQTKYRETFGTFDYLKGLTVQTDALVGDVSKKTTITTWTQDDPTLSYILNPRPTRIDINDDQNNSRHSAISYQTFALPSGVTSGVSCALPSDTTEYAANGTTVLRQTHTTYRTDSTYINSSRRIIGLPDTQFLYEGAGATLLSKVDYQYDLADDASNQYLVATSSVAVNHDTAYNDTNFRQGRANLCIRHRYDVSTPSTANNPSLAAKFSTGYDTAGNVAFSRDPSDHKTTFSYADKFVQTGTPSTVAYLTKITDPDGFFSTIQYDYDLGAVQETTDPKLARQRTTYDAAGRVSRVEINNGPSDDYTNGAYTRYVYDTTLARVNRFSLLQAGPDENFVFQQLDGIGRVTATASIFPNSAGGYRGQAMIYDTMGRVSSQSNPTEMTHTWGATGDDSAWVYTMQTYDWKGRPRITTNPDQTTRQFDYTGCGCAGGEQVTFTDESSRKQRTTYDVLGRVAKTEAFQWDGSTVYATTVYSYNGRDQATLVRQYQGTDGSPVFQDTVMTYDGHGRLQTRKLPRENSACQYEYYADDLLKKKTDPRDAKVTYTYNGRHLVTIKSYFKPGQVPPGSLPDAVPEVDPVNFDYDEAGNRLWMENGGHEHGQGRTDYAYDTFSRLKSETQ
jgi:YD repeat-containing protein